MAAGDHRSGSRAGSLIKPNPAASAAARKLPNLALTVRSQGLMPAAVHVS